MGHDSGDVGSWLEVFGGFFNACSWPARRPTDVRRLRFKPVRLERHHKIALWVV